MSATPLTRNDDGIVDVFDAKSQSPEDGQRLVEQVPRLRGVTPERSPVHTVTLVHAAAEGDRACWDALVERFSGLVWSVARGFGMSKSDAAAISQTTWLRLAEHINRIENPEHVGAWLVKTTRRECLHQRRARGAKVIVEEDQLKFDPRVAPRATPHVLAGERDAALWQCFDQLPERSRTLLLMLLTDPPIHYTEIADTLDMPIGSIGPTRSRILATLLRRVEAAGVSADD